MKPSIFDESNKSLLPPNSVNYSDNVSGIEPLSVWTDGEQCVSLWRPSWRERLSILIFGKVWLALLSGTTQPPALVVGEKRYFRDDKED
jgi:hypothetical protein